MNNEQQIGRNEKAEKVVGKRVNVGQPFDFPMELGYKCPVCKEESELFYWSEYNGFLYCESCNTDYPSAICLQDNPKKAIEVYLSCVAQALSHQKAELREKVVDVDLPPFAKDADKETHGAYYQRGYKAAIRKVVALLDNPLKE